MNAPLELPVELMLPDDWASEKAEKTRQIMALVIQHPLSILA